MPNLMLLTPPTDLPVSVEQVMATARVEDEAEEELFARHIRAAAELIQEFSGCQLLQAEYRLDLSHWPRDCVRLPRSNRAAVTAVEYRPSSGGPLLTLAAELYQVNSRRQGVSEVWPAFNTFWPSTVWNCIDAVQVTYTSGVSDPSLLPAHAITAIEQLAIHLYNHPAGSCDIPPGVQTLIRAFSLRSALLDRQMTEEQLSC